MCPQNSITSVATVSASYSSKVVGCGEESGASPSQENNILEVSGGGRMREKDLGRVLCPLCSNFFLYNSSYLQFYSYSSYLQLFTVIYSPLVT